MQEIIDELDQIVTDWEEGGCQPDATIGATRTINVLMARRRYNDILVPVALKHRIIKLSRVYETTTFYKNLLHELGLKD